LLLGFLGLKRKRPIALREAAGLGNGAAPKAFLNDRPSINGDRVIFVSTEEDIGIRVQGWNAIFSLDFKTSVTKRLTPPGVTDYSPAVSPSGTTTYFNLLRLEWQFDITMYNLLCNFKGVC